MSSQFGSRFGGLLFLFLFLVVTCEAQSSSFTYQGRLSDGGTAASGNYDLQFALWDSASGGTQIGSSLTLNSVPVSNGVFTVSLDFGAGSFSGANRFVEVSARPSGAASFTLLTPRQPVTSTPYAVRSVSSASADNATNAANATTATNSTQLGGVAANQYVQTNDLRLTDSRTPTSGSSNYVQTNPSSAQNASFNISGNGTVGGALTAGTQFNIGSNRVFSVSGGTGGFETTNTVVGVTAGESLTPGDSGIGSLNSFFGMGAGHSTTTGQQNTFFGTFPGAHNTTGSRNAFFGDAAGLSNTQGTYNSIFGSRAGEGNTTGSGNSIFGSGAGGGTTGNNNTLLGFQAGVLLDNLSNATAIGANASVGQNNALVLGSINGFNTATSDTNVGIGTTTPSKRLEVGTSNIGDGISLFGTAPAFFLSGGAKNEKAALGFAGSAGLYSTDAAAGDTVLRAVSGRLILQHGGLGAGLILNSSNTVSISTLGSAGGSALCRNSSNEIANCSSSLRYKTNVAAFSDGMNIINRLRPISFEWKQNHSKDIGLGAEEVEQVEPLLTFRNDKGEIEGVKYNQLSAVFINAFKEQQAQIATLRAANAALNARLHTVEKSMRKKVGMRHRHG